MEYSELESDHLKLLKPDECYAEDILKYLNKNVTKYMMPKQQEHIEECLDFLAFAQHAIVDGTDYNYVIVDKKLMNFMAVVGQVD